MQNGRRSTRHQCLSAESLVRTVISRTRPANSNSRHQCLSAESLVRTRPWRTCIAATLRVTNAFRLRVWLGQVDAITDAWMDDNVTNAFRLRVWLGPAPPGHRATGPPGVTNAFRLRVWLGPETAVYAAFREYRHQCLSAESLVRTVRIAYYQSLSDAVSPMPFG